MEAAEPKTLQEAIVYFSDAANCRTYLVARRWPKGVTCPRCESSNVLFLEKYNRWHCREGHAAPQFTLKTGTVMEDSPISLDKWLMVMWQIVNSKNGISSCEVHRAIGITQKSAWFMDHRIRFAFGHGSWRETLWRSRSRRIFHRRQGAEHARIKARAKDYRNRRQGQSCRDGHDGARRKVRAIVVDNRRKKGLQKNVREHVEAGAAIFSDELKSYDGLETDYQHAVINHAVEYANGNVHTNSMENFWSLLKRGLHGTYVSVEPFHLFRYLDEQTYRFNNRHMTDIERFDIAVKGIVGKRLTFEQLTGKTATQAEEN